MSEFIWTDENIIEFIRYTQRRDRDNTGYYSDIQDFKKSKQQSEKKEKLFTTSDGKDIYDEGQLIYYVDYEKCVVMRRLAKDFTTDTKYYSTPDIPNEYVLMNKPCLSANDIFKLCGTWWLTEGAEENHQSYIDEKKLKQLVKEKINQ